MDIRFVVLATFVVACDPDAPDPNRCPEDLPATCPTPAPSFATQVFPIIQSLCQPCHRAGGEAEVKPFDDYAAVSANWQEMLNQVYTCRMPQPPADPPTAQERATLLAWFVCEAPNN